MLYFLARAQTGTVIPKLQAVFEGGASFIRCTSTTTPTWTKDQKPVSSDLVIGNELVMIDVSEEDGGLYTCHGSSDSTPFTATSVLYVGGNTNVNILEVALILMFCMSVPIFRCQYLALL